MGLDILIATGVLARSKWEQIGSSLFLGMAYLILQLINTPSTSPSLWDYLIFYSFAALSLLTSINFRSPLVLLSSYLFSILMQGYLVALGQGTLTEELVTVEMALSLGGYAFYWNWQEGLFHKTIYDLEHDSLTGALTRKGLESWLSVNVGKPENSELSQSPPVHGAILFCDLDNLKSINDLWGHDIGDLAIREMAHRLSQNLRPQDALVRFGGDEFQIWIPGVSAREAKSITYKLHKAVTQDSLIPISRERIPTLSLGISMGWCAGPLEDSTIWKADEALLMAKRSGKNSVMEWSSKLSSPPTVLSSNRPTVIQELVKTMQLVWNQIPKPALFVDPEGRICFANTAFLSLVGYSWEDIDQKNPSLLSARQTPPELYRTMWQTLVLWKSWHGPFLNQRADGTTWWEILEIYPVVQFEKLVGFFAFPQELTFEQSPVLNKTHSSQSRFWFGNLSWAFQPIVDISTDTPVGYEALVRPFWGNEAVPPDVFFQLADALNARQQADWECLYGLLAHIRQQGIPPGWPKLFVNIYAETLGNVEQFMAWLNELIPLLANTSLVLEILEKEAHKLPFDIFHKIQKDVPRSVEWAIDDLGTMESNIYRYIGWYPTWVKLDRSWLVHFLHDPVLWKRVTGLMQWISAQGAHIVIEGVETEEELQILKKTGFALGQGYLWGRPTPWPAPHQLKDNVRETQKYAKP